MQELVIRKNPEIMKLAEIFLDTNKLENIEANMIQLSQQSFNSIFPDSYSDFQNEDSVNKASALAQLSSPVDTELLERKSNLNQNKTSEFLLKRANENQEFQESKLIKQIKECDFGNTPTISHIEYDYNKQEKE